MAVTLSGKLGTTGHPTPKTLSGKLGTTGHPQKKLGTQTGHPICRHDADTGAQFGEWVPSLGQRVPSWVPSLNTQKRPKHLIRASAGAQWCPVSRKKRSIRARGKRV
jgi:hypothetical protein